MSDSQSQSDQGQKARTSVVIATKDKAEYLRRTLASILMQATPFKYEVIVVDDGSTDETPSLCKQEIGNQLIRYVRLENPNYRNPSVARNVGYRLARGDVVICQSDEVIHSTPNTIERLTNKLQPHPAGQPGEFLIATVWDYDWRLQRRLRLYTGIGFQRPFFFLGSLWRRDLYNAGGNDEEFIAPGYEDDWLAACLMRGLNLTPRYLPDVEGLHQHHRRPLNLAAATEPSRILFQEKMRRAEAGEIPFVASGGAWEYRE